MRFEITFSALQQRAIALALFLVPLTGLSALLFMFAFSIMDHYRQVSLLVRELKQESTIVEQSQTWHQQLALTKGSSSWQDLFVPANLAKQGALAQAITANGGTIETATIKRTETDGATQLHEHVVFNAEMKSLVHILEALRTLRPLFGLQSAVIEDREVSTTGPRNVSNKLRVELDATSFERP